MKTFKKSNKNKKTRVCKKDSAALAIGKLEKYTDTFILTYGQFSLIDALLAILDQTGPAHVAVSTWTAAHADLTKSADLMSSAEILSFRMIVDRSFKTRQPKYYNHMIDLFGQNCIREINTHAKFLTIRNYEWDIVVRTSMNLNGNPRLENIEISDNSEFADFFENIVSEVFRTVAPGERQTGVMELPGVPDTTYFNPVSAETIKHSSVKEASFTHEIKKDR